MAVCFHFYNITAVYFSFTTSTTRKFTKERFGLIQTSTGCKYYVHTRSIIDIKILYAWNIPSYCQKRDI